MVNCITLPNELNTIVSWFNAIRLQFNNEQFQSITFTRSCITNSHSYTMNGPSVTKTSCKKCLGVLFNVNLDQKLYFYINYCRVFKTFFVL